MGNQKYKQAHREAGLCVYCSKPVHPGRSKCLTHIRTHAINTKRNRKKRGESYLQSERDRKELRRQQGLCTACGAPTDGKHVTCFNCRDEFFYERFENATPIV